MEINFWNYDNHVSDTVEVNIKDIPRQISFTYDNGRLVVYVNEIEVYSTYGANDCHVEVNLLTV